MEATDADASDPLAYRWLLDGRLLAAGTAWEMARDGPQTNPYPLVGTLPLRTFLLVNAP